MKEKILQIFIESGKVYLFMKESIKKIAGRPFYFYEALVQMDYVGVTSLPLIILTGLFTGMVIAVETAYSLEMFGVKAYIGKGVAVAQVRELGPVIGALMVNGRVGAGMTAELSSMVITEQIEALRALGVDIFKKLVVPRILAGIIMLPLLIVICDIAGIVGGGVISIISLKISGNFYFSSALSVLDYYDVIIGITKPFVFGLIITGSACYCGLTATGGPQGVGKATMKSVMASSLAILFADFLLTKFFYWIF